jgi:hypothetical protein
MSNFSRLSSLSLVKALVDAGGNISDVSRAFQSGYGHLSGQMLSMAGFPSLEIAEARKLFDALMAMADLSFSFSELDYLRIPFAGGKSIIERAGVRRRGRHRRYRSIYGMGVWEFDDVAILTELNSRIFVISNGASKIARTTFPEGAYVSVGAMTVRDMRTLGPAEILDTTRFMPISRMLEGLSCGEIAASVETFSLAMEFLVRDRKAFQQWMLHPRGGLSGLVAFQRERLKQKKRRPFLIARYANLQNGGMDTFSYRKPIKATLDNLERLCRDYKPPHWKDLKVKRDEVVDGEKVFNALLFDASFIFANFVLATHKCGDRVPIGWGLISTSPS